MPDKIRIRLRLSEKLGFSKADRKIVSDGADVAFSGMVFQTPPDQL